MTIHLPGDLVSRVEAAVRSGQFATVDDAMAEAARLLVREMDQIRPAKSPNDEKDAGLGSVGALRDAAHELDEIVADAYKRREEPWRDIRFE